MQFTFGMKPSPNIPREQIEQSGSVFRRGQRWNSAPETFLLNDYEALAVLLFSENYDQLFRYAERARESVGRVEPPMTRLDKAKAVWESVLPHRRLILKSSGIAAVNSQGGQEYAAASMSDGERVVFYLIGQCLCVRSGSIVIIDEPEVHLHKSIQTKLWDAIEASRPDCTFVYLTHDLTFASERTGATKVCLKGYDGASFDWYEIPQTEGIPEDILLEVLGSRKPVLFVEGEQGSHDLEIYQMAYPSYTVKPLGSCEKVLEAVKVFSSLEGLHHLSCHGIVDRDYRGADELAAYQRHGVFAPHVAEVENLFLLEGLLLAVARWMRVDDPEAKVREIKAWVIAEFDKFKEKFALESTRYHVNMALNSFGGGGSDLNGYLQEFNQFTSSIDPSRIYAEKLAAASRAVQEADFDWIIRNFNHKSLVNQVGKFFELKPASFTDKVKVLVKSDEFGSLEAIRQHLPPL